MKKISNDKFYIHYNVIKENSNFNERADLIYGERSEVDGSIYDIYVDDGSSTKRIIIYNDNFNVKENRIILNNKNLYVLLYFGDLLKIDLSTMTIEKKLLLDEYGTYHNIYNLNNNLIIEGELDVYCITYNMEIVRQFSSPDIIINFKIKNNKIIIEDFNNNKYYFDDKLN